MEDALASENFAGSRQSCELEEGRMTRIFANLSNM